MSDSEHSDIPKEDEPTHTSDVDERSVASSETVLDNEDSTGNPLLDKLLEEGILKGMARMA